MQCILCHHNTTIIQDRVRRDDLVALYQKNFGIDISNIVSSDLLYMHCQECDLRFFVCENGIIPTGNDTFYNALNLLPWYYFDEKHEYHYAKDFIAPDSKVLEVGCGKAAFAEFLPHKENYIGLEFSTQAKEMAAKRGIIIQNTPIEEYCKEHCGKFDVSCSFQVLEHVSNPHTFLQSQITCLQSIRGGDTLNNTPKLIIAVPSEDSFLHDCVNGILNMPPHHISRFSDKTLHYIAKLFDLHLIKLYHEPIQPEHREFYKSIMWAKKFLPTPLIDKGILRKFINKFGILGKRWIQIPPNTYGHTVIAVYEKNTSCKSEKNI
ncbi:class I SAM-dependent methyltransferase [Helicobacter equorum]|uniref:class I SAM-dependent methyltransferase n=1 Tax=Helicobacter equorum TaxID=361872 RepID=UPI00360FC33F